MTKVAVIGCGALGLNYATRLLEAQVYHGEPIDVNLVLRRDFDLVSKEGLVVEYGKAQDAKNYLRFSPEQLVGKVFRTTQDLCERKGPMDWVLVCCKSYAIDEDLHLSLAPLVGEHTNIVVIMNGLGVEEKFVDWFGSQRVFGALSLIACNRGSNPPIEPGPLIVHVYADLKLEVAHVTDNAEKTQLVIGLFKRTTPEDLVQPTTNLLRARWSKLCWNLTYAGIAVAMGGLTCDVIVHDPSLREFATHVIRDVIRVANADILRQHRERHRGTVGAYGSGDTQVGEQAPPCVDLLDEKTILDEIWVRTANLGPYKASTVLDLAAGAQMEMRYLFEVPLERARALRQADPTLQFSYLESVILMVEAVSRMSECKAALGIPWQPTFFSDLLERPGP